MKVIIASILLLCCFSGTPSIAQDKSGKGDAAFMKFFRTFQAAVQHKAYGSIRTMLHYPFYTRNEEAADGKNYPSEPISEQEYTQYRDNLLHADVIRLLPGTSSDELSEADPGATDSYYGALRKLCDPGSKIYEAYIQYALKNGTSESYFAFVFGKVKGSYRAIAYYAKWPVKY